MKFWYIYIEWGFYENNYRNDNNFGFFIELKYDVFKYKFYVL